MKTVGVVRFPGTNCDRDVYAWVAERGYKPEWLWHLDRFEKRDYHAVVLPGGFSYGDYLRSGALAAKSPVMDSIREYAAKGGPVLGICNGFQILAESGLVPGTLVRNEGLRFIDDWVTLSVKNKKSFWSANLKQETLCLPVAHGDGRFYANADTLKALHDKEQVWLKYEGGSPNGSLQDIAGVVNEAGNVAGLMPHPERAIFDWMGGVDGLGFL